MAQTCAPCWAASEAKAAMANVSVVQHSQVEILAPGGVAGSTLKIRVTGEVPNFFGSMAVLFPGLPSGPFKLKAESTFRQEGW